MNNQTRGMARGSGKSPPGASGNWRRRAVALLSTLLLPFFTSNILAHAPVRLERPSFDKVVSPKVGFTVQITDPEGNVTEYDYDTSGRLVSTTSEGSGDDQDVVTTDTYYDDGKLETFEQGAKKATYFHNSLDKIERIEYLQDGSSESGERDGRRGFCPWENTRRGG